MDRQTELFEEHRGRLTGLAYRMLGARGEAEDVVQDAWLRWRVLESEEIENAEAFLVRVTTRLCLDRLKSARAQREVYVGPWLPEPVTDAAELSPHTTAQLAEDLSYALLLSLERLSPAERAAFLLHDVFDASYSEIAAVLERKEATCRKLVSRARLAVRSEERTTEVDAAEHRRLLEGFVAAVMTGDVETFSGLLAEEAIALSDGGGKVLAALNPIYGRDKVTRFVFGIARKQQADGAEISVRAASINGRPGLLIDVDRALDQCVLIDTVDGLVTRLYFVRNPEKLERLASG
ncbi:MAG: RNA polymerase sigma factor SigJ [Acidobacteriota bacterium]